MPLLYYWRGDNYRRDLDWGAGYHLNQGNPLLHEIELGDSIWAFTRTRDGRYALAAKLICKAKTINPPGFRYGAYRVWGDLKASRYFRVDPQPDLESLLRSLSIRAQARVLGRAFQGHAAVRRITGNDHRLLEAYSRDLLLEPRARLLPEEALEARLLLGDPERVTYLLRAQEAGVAEERIEYLSKTAVTRNPELVADLRRRYAGRCQISGWDPRREFDHDLCEAHHIRWLSRGGDDDLSNLVLISPNLHRAIHRLDAQFDWRDHAFVFGHRRIQLQLLEHPLA